MVLMQMVYVSESESGKIDKVVATKPHTTASDFVKYASEQNLGFN